MFGPKTLAEAKRYRYGMLTHTPYDQNFCAAEMLGGYKFRQCRSKPGHGPDGIFCKQHAKMREKEK